MLPSVQHAGHASGCSEGAVASTAGAALFATMWMNIRNTIGGGEGSLEEKNHMTINELGRFWESVQKVKKEACYQYA